MKISITIPKTNEHTAAPVRTAAPVCLRLRRAAGCALREAESYPGPAIVICYCPCLEQHIKAGMSCTQDEMKKAVECGYWHLYRYDPRRIAEGKNPFQLDSKEPDTSKVMDFLMGENRFASLKNNFPDKADALYAKEVEDVKARYAKYKKLAEG